VIAQHLIYGLIPQINYSAINKEFRVFTPPLELPPRGNTGEEDNRKNQCGNSGQSQISRLFIDSTWTCLPGRKLPKQVKSGEAMSSPSVKPRLARNGSEGKQALYWKWSIRAGRGPCSVRNLRVYKSEERFSTYYCNNQYKAYKKP